VRVAVLTVSDRSSRGEREDASGPALRKAVEALGHEVAAAEIVPDDRAAIAARLRALGGKADLVLTTGGTGLAPRDVTPEATRDVVEREIPGLPEEIRRRSAAKDPRGLLSRATAGILPGGAVVLNLPGSPGGAVECLGFAAATLVHAVAVARGTNKDCGGGFTKAGS
jgi:molybdopterin adenylyltransferase